MSALTYSAERAKATADKVARTWPCQGVRILPHRSVDRWVTMRIGTGPFRDVPAVTAIETMKKMRARQRAARKGKRHG